MALLAAQKGSSGGGGGGLNDATHITKVLRTSSATQTFTITELTEIYAIWFKYGLGDGGASFLNNNATDRYFSGNGNYGISVISGNTFTFVWEANNNITFEIYGK